ncbi:hypothetical protein MMB17_18615 [Methylobacterium organophilum]|uniref:hypothetical protein n=1 Tax=Methylobacterium organophilum TaxID=410 RepID=UPI001F138A6F|nr:hypothetical protein [Methylobacterium organophilum]UMY16676.1 hypothetical protein MMB17_18615 [Methylobacterium organophilum]
MIRKALLAALALACVASPAFAMAYPPGQDGSAVGLASGLLFVSALAAAGGLLLAAAHRFNVLGLVVAAGAAVILALGCDAAFAQAAATIAEPSNNTAVVTVPYGSWLTSAAAGIQEIVVSVIMAVIAFACRRLPAAAGAVVRGILTQQLVERAIAFGMSTVAGAVAGKTLSVPVGNAVLANALNYAVTNAPTWFVKWIGGEQAIRDHIIALLPMEEQASLAGATATAITPTPTPVAPV